MTAAYRSPAALQRALSDRAKAATRTSGGDPGELVIQFYLYRLLARVFQHNRNGWILKGGQALLVRWPEARHSRDLDLLATSDMEGLEEAVAELIAAAHRDLGDFLRFEHYDTSSGRQEHENRMVRFRTFCGTKYVGIVSVDVVANLAPLGQPDGQEVRPPIDIDLGAKPQMVWMWPLEDHVADKIAAMYEQHAGGPSSRVKDLVDLIYIASHAPIDGHTAHPALRREVDRRTAAGVDLVLPTAFNIPDRHSWETGYRREAKRVRQLEPQYQTLAGAHELAERFVTPLLADHPPGRWEPTAACWTD